MSQPAQPAQPAIVPLPEASKSTAQEKASPQINISDTAEVPAKSIPAPYPSIATSSASTATPFHPTGSTTQQLLPAVVTPSTSVVIPASRPAPDSPADSRPAKRTRTNSPLPEKSVLSTTSSTLAPINTSAQQTLPVSTSIPAASLTRATVSQANLHSDEQLPSQGPDRSVAPLQSPTSSQATNGISAASHVPVPPITLAAPPTARTATIQQPQMTAPTLNPGASPSLPSTNQSNRNAIIQKAVVAGSGVPSQPGVQVSQPAPIDSPHLLLWGGRSGGSVKRFNAPIQITGFPEAFFGQKILDNFHFQSRQQAEAFVAFSVPRGICSSIIRLCPPGSQNPFSIEVHGIPIAEYFPGRQPDFLLDGRNFSEQAHFLNEVDIFLAGYHASVAFCNSPPAFHRFSELHPGARLTQLAPRIANAPQNLAAYGDLMANYISDAAITGPPNHGQAYGFGLWAIPNSKADGPSTHGEIWQGLFACLKQIYRVARADAAQINMALTIVQKLGHLCVIYRGGDVAMGYLRKFEDQIRSLALGGGSLNSPLYPSTSSVGSAPHSRSSSTSHPQQAPHLAPYTGNLEGRSISPTQVKHNARQNSLTPLSGGFDSSRRASAPLPSRVASPVESSLPASTANLGLGLPSSGLQRRPHANVLQSTEAHTSRAASQPLSSSAHQQSVNGLSSRQEVNGQAPREDIIMEEVPSALSALAVARQQTIPTASSESMHDLLLKVQQKVAADAPTPRSPSPPPATIPKFYQRDEIILEEQDVPGDRPTVSFQFDVSEALLNQLKAYVVVYTQC